MADWRALAYGVQTGMELGKDIRERRGRKLYGEAMLGKNQSYSGGIPMPGEEGQQQGMSYEGPSLQADLDNLTEAYATGGIDADQFHSGVQNLGMRSFVNVKKAWDTYNAAPDSETKRQALQEILYSIPGSGMSYVTDLGDGRFATVPHDEEGQPIQDAQGLVLTDEVVNSMVSEATADPDQWMKFFGMSTQDMADYRYKEAQTKASEGGERRAEDLHPLQKQKLQAEIGEIGAKADYYRSGGSGGSSKTGWKEKDAAGWFQKNAEMELRALSETISNTADFNNAPSFEEGKADILGRMSRGLGIWRVTGGDPVDAAQLTELGWDAPSVQQYMAQHGVPPSITGGQASAVPAPMGGQAATGAGKVAAGLTPVSSPDEARTLPPGTKFITPDGRTGTVPGGP